MKRRILSALIDWYQSSDQELPAWLDRACRKDPVLAKERAEGEILTRALERAPQPRPGKSRSNLAAKVMRQITEEDYAAAQAGSGSSGFAWAGWIAKSGAVAAVALVAAVVFQFRTDDQKVEPEAADPAPLAVNEEPIDLPQIDPSAIQIDEDWENPLNKEIKYVISDAKGALGFLANSFVPKRYLEDERLFLEDDDQA